MNLQAKSEEMKKREIHRLIAIHKEKSPDDFAGLQTKITLIFGKNESHYITDQFSQVIINFLQMCTIIQYFILENKQKTLKFSIKDL